MGAALLDPEMLHQHASGHSSAFPQISGSSTVRAHYKKSRTQPRSEKLFGGRKLLNLLQKLPNPHHHHHRYNGYVQPIDHNKNKEAKDISGIGLFFNVHLARLQENNSLPWDLLFSYKFQEPHLKANWQMQICLFFIVRKFVLLQQQANIFS